MFTPTNISFYFTKDQFLSSTHRIGFLILKLHPLLVTWPWFCCFVSWMFKARPCSLIASSPVLALKPLEFWAACRYPPRYTEFFRCSRLPGLNSRLPGFSFFDEMDSCPYPYVEHIFLLPIRLHIQACLHVTLWATCLWKSRSKSYCIFLQCI